MAHGEKKINKRRSKHPKRGEVFKNKIKIKEKTPQNMRKLQKIYF